MIIKIEHLGAYYEVNFNKSTVYCYEYKTKYSITHSFNVFLNQFTKTDSVWIPRSSVKLINDCIIKYKVFL